MKNQRGEVKIKYSAKFLRAFSKLPRKIQEKIEVREQIFKVNPFDSRLHTHKLHGERKDEWAYSVDYSYRIAFIFLKVDVVFYSDIGTHDELYR